MKKEEVQTEANPLTAVEMQRGVMPAIVIDRGTAYYIQFSNGNMVWQRKDNVLEVPLTERERTIIKLCETILKMKA